MAKLLQKELWTENTSAFLGCLFLALFVGLLGSLAIIFNRRGIFGYGLAALALVSLAAAVGILRRKRWGAALGVVSFGSVFALFLVNAVGKPPIAWLSTIAFLIIFMNSMSFFRRSGADEVNGNVEGNRSPRT